MHCSQGQLSIVTSDFVVWGQAVPLVIIDVIYSAQEMLITDFSLVLCAACLIKVGEWEKAIPHADKVCICLRACDSSVILIYLHTIRRV